MLQSNSKPLTAAAVFRACNEMEDESDWHCAKGYCQGNTTSVTAPVRKAMSVRRRCLERLSQNMPHWQICRKELHPPEGKLVGLNLFSWVRHYQLPQLNGQPKSAVQCPLQNVLEDMQVCSWQNQQVWRSSLTQRSFLQCLLPAASLQEMLGKRSMWGLGRWDRWTALKLWAARAR